MLSRVLAIVSAALVVSILSPTGTAGAAAKRCRTACPDTASPTVTMSAPSSGSTVSAVVSVRGGAGDNVALASVAVSVDGGIWQSAAGTTSWAWSWNTASSPNGAHTLTARAVDASGNTSVTSRSVTVANAVPDTTAPALTISAPSAGATVSGAISVTGSASDDVALSRVEVNLDGGAWQPATGSAAWSWSWNTSVVPNGSHTLSVRASDASGNTTTRSVSALVSNGGGPSGPAPATQGTWVSPEGVKITVNSAGSWTIAQVYSILTASALDLPKVGAHLTINVQDQYTSQTQTNATYYGGAYTSVSSTMWLQGVNSGFSARPEDTLTHEYGHAWSMYWYYLAHNASWTSYNQARWTTADGSLTLATDTRTGSSYAWQIAEIVADDYRLLFGSSTSIAQRPAHLNTQIPDPRNLGTLRSFLFGSWRTT